MQAAASKALLRVEILGRRRRVSTSMATAFAQRIAEIGSVIAAQSAAEAVAAYWPIKGEASPLPLLEVLAARGIATALPAIAQRYEPLVFRRWRPGEALIAAEFGLEEPAATAPLLCPDLLFLPLVAFDRNGYRLGYGAGYYDRTLAQLRVAGPPITVGIAYAFQELPEIPAEAHDQKLDYVLTDREWINCQTGPFDASSFRR
jgi:5-formyltetrahydrofolate cyclo-ligase